MSDNLPAQRSPMELSATDVVAQVAKIQTIMREVMQDGQHYGVIPGTEKPTLLKPGAEKLGLTFRLAPTFTVEQKELPNGHREYDVICTVTHIPTGQVMGQGVGCCSTMESKYRYRRSDPEPTDKPVPKEYWNLRNTDPAAAQEMLGGKDFVTKKIDGNWMICKKSAERMENPDLADQYNTVLKMAKKRAQVDAILTATAASDIFTQDVEEMQESRKPADEYDQRGVWENIPPIDEPWSREQEEKPKPKPRQQAPAASTKEMDLWGLLKEHCNGDNKAAGDVLNQLSGKRFISDLSPAEKKLAIVKFYDEYLPKKAGCRGGKCLNA